MCYKGKRVKIIGAGLAVLILVSVALAACAGPAGPAGSAGPRGPAGPPGRKGADAEASIATVIASPAVLPTVLSGNLEVSGAGFIPGERIEMCLAKAVPAYKGSEEKVDCWFDVNTVVNDQGAFYVKTNFGLARILGKMDEGPVVLVVYGSEGTEVTYPMLIKEATE
ncbi:hypothetical protein ACFLU4_04235 [Chloroflexota bacterium]